jgi:hypothetical protein
MTAVTSSAAQITKWASAGDIVRNFNEDTVGIFGFNIRLLTMSESLSARYYQDTVLWILQFE